MAKRRSFPPEFKAQVVLEVVSGTQSGAQACREHRIKESVLSRWKQEFIERSPQVFARSQVQSWQEERMAEWERLVGQLTCEWEMAKKASLVVTSRWNGSGNS